jgi:hypothetical protein
LENEDMGDAKWIVPAGIAFAAGIVIGRFWRMVTLNDVNTSLDKAEQKGREAAQRVQAALPEQNALQQVVNRIDALGSQFDSIVPATDTTTDATA